MNKNEFIKRISLFRKEQKLNVTECYVSHGGSCLMLGIRKETGDIDLTVFDKSIIEKLIRDGNKTFDLPAREDAPAQTVVKYDYDIDVHLAHRKYVEMKSVLVVEQGVQYVNAEQTLLDKKALNRPKDQDDIKALEKLVKAN